MRHHISQQLSGPSLSSPSSRTTLYKGFVDSNVSSCKYTDKMAAVKKLLVVFAICCLFVAFVAASGDDDDDDDDVTVAPPPVRWLVGASLVMVDHFEIDSK